MACSVTKVPYPVTFCESTILLFGRGSTCSGGKMQQMAQESVTCCSWEKLMCNCSDTTWSSKVAHSVVQFSLAERVSLIQHCSYDQIWARKEMVQAVWRFPAISGPSTLQSWPCTIKLTFIWATEKHWRSRNSGVTRKWKLLFINGCKY